MPYIHEFISNTYWAKGRTMETMQRCIDHSLCFGMYIDKKQIGFARVVSDFGQFAYLMDVFIDESQRGNGYSKKLMHYILSYEPLKDVKTWRLATSDAQGLYQQFGFRPLEDPNKHMELLK